MLHPGQSVPPDLHPTPASGRNRGTARRSGTAVDGKPGVLASRRIQGERGDRQDSLGTEIARGAAATALSAGTAPVGLPGQLVNSAGQTAINDRPMQPAAASEDALLLDSKPVMDLFVAQPF